MSARLFVGLLVIIELSACAPVPLERAEEECFERARAASRPRGEAYIGANSAGGGYGGLRVSVSSDFIQGRDPSQVYESCVYQKSGLHPSQPLYSRPDWKG